MAVIRLFLILSFTVALSFPAYAARLPDTDISVADLNGDSIMEVFVTERYANKTIKRLRIFADEGEELRLLGDFDLDVKAGLRSGNGDNFWYLIGFLPNDDLKWPDIYIHEGTQLFDEKRHVTESSYLVKMFSYDEEASSYIVNSYGTKEQDEDEFWDLYRKTEQLYKVVLDKMDLMGVLAQGLDRQRYYEGLDGAMDMYGFWLGTDSEGTTVNTSIRADDSEVPRAWGRSSRLAGIEYINTGFLDMNGDNIDEIIIRTREIRPTGGFSEYYRIFKDEEAGLRFIGRIPILEMPIEGEAGFPYPLEEEVRFDVRMDGKWRRILMKGHEARFRTVDEKCVKEHIFLGYKTYAYDVNKGRYVIDNGMWEGAGKKQCEWRFNCAYPMDRLKDREFSEGIVDGVRDGFKSGTSDLSGFWWTKRVTTGRMSFAVLLEQDGNRIKGKYRSKRRKWRDEISKEDCVNSNGYVRGVIFQNSAKLIYTNEARSVKGVAYLHYGRNSLSWSIQEDYYGTPDCPDSAHM